MRIAFVSPFFPLKGGIARFSTILRDKLLEKGHAIDAFSFSRLYPRIVLRDKSPYEPGMRSCEGIAAVLDMLNPVTWISVALQIRRLGSDVILCPFWQGLYAPIFVLIRVFSGKKMIVLMHNFSSHERFAGEKLLRDLLIASADGVVTLSRHVAGKVKRSYPNVPLRSLFHPVYDRESDMPSQAEARRILGFRDDGRILLFFGYVRAYKGLDILVEAMPEILRRSSGTRLLVAGEFHHGEKTIRERIERLGISAQVTIESGFVPGDRIPVFFSAADVVVLPYREASQSGVVQQAYGFGRPVVVSDRGGLPEYVREGETGAMVRSLEPSDFATGVCDFLDSMDTIPCETMVARQAETLSWDVFAMKLEAFIREVAD